MKALIVFLLLLHINSHAKVNKKEEVIWLIPGVTSGPSPEEVNWINENQPLGPSEEEINWSNQAENEIPETPVERSPALIEKEREAKKIIGPLPL